MNVAQMKQIYWKEYRTQRSIWLGITLMVVVLQAIVYAMMPQNANNPLETLMGIGAILTTFYALASAGVLFAGEREEETDGWLMILPTSRLSLVSGKVLWLLSSWVIAIGLTCFTAYLPYWGMEWGTGKPESHALNMLRYGGSMVAWGIFFSLLCRHVYSSIALATIAFLISASMIQFIAGLMDVLTGVAIVGSVVVGRHWLSSDRLVALPQFGIWADKFNLERALASSIESSPGWKMFRRQLWLEWRNAKWVVAGLGVFTFCGVIVVGTFEILISMCCYLPLVLGLMSYRGEHRYEQYRFRGNRGVSPLAVWSAKQIVWLGSLFVALSVVLILALSHVSSYSEGYRRLATQLMIADGFYPEYLMQNWSESLQFALVFWSGLSLVLYTSAQTCSLLISRGVSAALVAIVAAVLVVSLGTVTIMFDVPRLIAFYFPAFCLFGFSLWQTSRLMSERIESRDWWQTIGVLSTLGVVCSSSWVVWRLTEITMPDVFAGLVALIPVIVFLKVSIAGGFLFLFVLLTTLFAFRQKLDAFTLFIGWASLHIGSSVLFAGIAISESQMEPPHAADLAWLTDQEAKETDKQYRELALQMTPIPQLMDKVEDGDDLEDKTQEVFRGQRDPSEEQLNWLKDHQTELDQLLDITRRKGCAPDGEERFWRLHDRLAPLLQLSAVQAEREGDLESAWGFHLAFLRMQGHALDRQSPMKRSFVLSYVNQLYQIDLRRWLNHPQQTSELLAKAANEFTEIIEQTDKFKDAIATQNIIQRQSISENSLGNWEGGDSYEELAQKISQGLYHLPWEAARAQAMLKQVNDHQSDLAKGLQTGENRLYYQEIASPEMERYGYYSWPRFETYPAWENWGARSSRPTRSDLLWQHTQTTTLFTPSFIEKFGQPPNRGEWYLIDELNWIRGQRLFLLALAFRAAELETGDRPDSLMQLATGTDAASVKKVLADGEKLTGKIWNRRANQYIVKEYEHLTFRLYYDPISDRPFQMEVIERWLN